MYAPNFAAPQSINDAVRMLGADGAKPLSGGTDLVVQMRSFERTISIHTVTRWMDGFI